MTEPVSGQNEVESGKIDVLEIASGFPVRMDKEGIVRAHAAAYRIRHNLVKSGLVSDVVFSDYEKFGVNPVCVNRSKGDHMKAFFLLMTCIQQGLGIEVKSSRAHVMNRL